VTDLLATLQELEHLGVGFVSLTEALDTTTQVGRAMGGLLAIFSDFEREVRREPNPGRLGSCTGEWQTAGSADNRGPTRCGNPETAPRRR